MSPSIPPGIEGLLFHIRFSLSTVFIGAIKIYRLIKGELVPNPLWDYNMIYNFREERWVIFIHFLFISYSVNTGFCFFGSTGSIFSVISSFFLESMEAIYISYFICVTFVTSYFTRLPCFL